MPPHLKYSSVGGQQKLLPLAITSMISKAWPARLMKETMIADEPLRNASLVQEGHSYIIYKCELFGNPVSRFTFTKHYNFPGSNLASLGTRKDPSAGTSSPLVDKPESVELP